MNVHVRPAAATTADAEVIFRFISELAEYEKCLDQVEVTPELLHQQLAADSPPFSCLIAERDGEALGFALFFFGYSTWTGKTTLFLEDLYVTPAARGLGAGLSLMKALAHLATAKGCGRFEWNVLDWNQTAIHFYDQIGAYPMIGWTRYRIVGESLSNLGGLEVPSKPVLQIA